jgi:cell division protein FtsB
MTEIVTVLAQFGFPAVMAVIIFFAYQRQTEKLIRVIEANTSAMQNLGKTVEDVSRRVEDVEDAIHDLRSGRPV